MHFSLQSTASLGKFQTKLSGEKPIKGYSKNVRKEGDKPFVGAVKDENKKTLKIIDKIQRPQVNTDSNIIKQIERDMVAQQE